MLGPTSGVATAARRRARRRRRVIVLVVVLAVFVAAEVVHEVVNAAQPTARRSAGTWVAAVAPSVVSANLLSRTLSLVASKGATMSRPELTGVLARMEKDATSIADAVASSTLGPPTPTSKALLVRALRRRADGVHAFAVGVRFAVTPGSGAAAATLERAKSEMATADSDYAAFLRSLPSGSDPGQLPAVKWSSPSAFWSGMPQLARTLAAVPQLRPHHALTLVAISVSPRPEVIPTTTTTTTTTTIPAKRHATTTTTVPTKRHATTTTTTTTTTIPPRQIPSGTSPSVFAPTPTLTPIVVLRNEGNVTESKLVVTAALGGATTSSAVGALAPSDARYVRLGALGVHAATFGHCTQHGFTRDRCSSLVVHVSAGGRVRLRQTISVAFYVS